MEPTMQAVMNLKRTFRDALVSVAFHGSRARGTHRPESDYDLFVILEDYLSDEEIQSARTAVAGLNPSVHLHIVRKSELAKPENFLILQGIKQEGRILYDKGGFIRSCMDSMPAIPISRR
jgi:predicted nucleotidyltransferase